MIERAGFPCDLANVVGFVPRCKTRAPSINTSRSSSYTQLVIPNSITRLSYMVSSWYRRGVAVITAAVAGALTTYVVATTLLAPTLTHNTIMHTLISVMCIALLKPTTGVKQAAVILRRNHGSVPIRAQHADTGHRLSHFQSQQHQGPV